MARVVRRHLPWWELEGSVRDLIRFLEEEDVKLQNAQVAMVKRDSGYVDLQIYGLPRTSSGVTTKQGGKKQ